MKKRSHGTPATLPHGAQVRTVVSRLLADCGPAALCRMDANFVGRIDDVGFQRKVILAAILIITAFGMPYGFVMGVWRCPLQGIFSAVKMPVLFFAIMLASSLINTMLAQIMGSGLSFRQVCLGVLCAMAITAMVMGAVSPVVLLFILQAPGPDPMALGLPGEYPAVMRSMRVFWMILLAHIAVIGLSGIVGNLRLYRLLQKMTGTRRMAVRVLLTWVAISGFVGCELSWLLSPFVCKPNFPPHIVTRTYFESNFYEHVWRAIAEL